MKRFNVKVNELHDEYGQQKRELVCMLDGHCTLQKEFYVYDDYSVRWLSGGVVIPEHMTTSEKLSYFDTVLSYIDESGVLKSYNDAFDGLNYQRGFLLVDYLVDTYGLSTGYMGSEKNFGASGKGHVAFENGYIHICGYTDTYYGDMPQGETIDPTDSGWYISMNSEYQKGTKPAHGENFKYAHPIDKVSRLPESLLENFGDMGGIYKFSHRDDVYYVHIILEADNQ